MSGNSSNKNNTMKYNFDVEKLSDDTYQVVRKIQAVQDNNEFIEKNQILLENNDDHNGPTQETDSDELSERNEGQELPERNEGQELPERNEGEDAEAAAAVARKEDFLETEKEVNEMIEKNESKGNRVGGKKRTYKKHNAPHHKGRQLVISNKYTSSDKYSHALKTKKRKGKGKVNKKTNKNKKKITRS